VVVAFLSFSAPGRLLVLLLIPLLFFVVLVVRRRRSRYVMSFTNLGVLGEVLERPSGWQRHIPLALLALALATAGIAFAQPVVRLETSFRTSTIVMLVDVSGSMGAPDVYPIRLYAAVNGMHAFLATVPKNDKVGLVTFSDRVQVVSIPTTDRAAVNGELDSLGIEGGSALGAGVEQAVTTVVTSLRGDGADQASGGRLPGAVVFATDGGGNRGTIGTNAAAEFAKQAGVPIYGVTLGTRRGYILSGAGLLRREIPVPANPGTVALLARQSGGQAYDASNAQQLNTVYKHIATTVGRTSRRKAIASWFDLAAAILLIAGYTAARIRGGMLP